MVSVTEIIKISLSLRARWSILREKLKKLTYPYKIQIVQDLHDSDFALRKTYAEAMLLRFRTATRMGNIFFSDEAHYHVGGYVNKQNFHY